MKFKFTILLLFTYFLSFGQSKFSVTANAGIADFQFYTFGLSKENYLGTEFKIGLRYSFGNFYTGIKVSQYSYHNTSSTIPTQVEFATDLSTLGFKKAFVQESIGIAYIIPSIFMGYDFKLTSKFNIQVNTGISYVNGSISITRLSSLGGDNPVAPIVGYKKSQKSEFASGYYSIVLLGKITNSLSVGLDFSYQGIQNISYQDILNYKGISLIVQTKI